MDIYCSWFCCLCGQYALQWSRCCESLLFQYFSILYNILQLSRPFLLLWHGTHMLRISCDSCPQSIVMLTCTMYKCMYRGHNLICCYIKLFTRIHACEHILITQVFSALYSSIPVWYTFSLTVHEILSCALACADVIFKSKIWFGHQWRQAGSDTACGLCTLFCLSNVYFTAWCSQKLYLSDCWWIYLDITRLDVVNLVFH